MKFLPANSLWLALLLPFTVGAATPMLEGRMDRPLRYHPVGTDFVITNGAEFFNRPLYDDNTAFRVDAGDKPEFSFYLPGRGGNWRFGFKTPTTTKWMFEADQVVTRYRPGSMIYEITNASIHGGTLRLTALPFANTQGLIVRAEWLDATAPVQLFWAYGGVNGQRGARDGDIGAERVPVSEFFQLQPAYCQGNVFSIDSTAFTLRSKPAVIAGLMPPGSKLALADAAKWASLGDLLASSGKPMDSPVVVGQVALLPGEPIYLGLQRIESSDLPPTEKVDALPRVFTAAEEHRRRLAETIIIDTPDPFLNAAAAALGPAADGVWDERQGAVMHGAVAWRTKLLGWRGDYINDELGWHDRAVRDFTYWAGRQNTSPVPPAILPADPASNLSRHESSLHSNGDLSNSHYDMNLVFIDAIFRHLLWTGDLDFARKMWPVIQRHLAWEQRLFRRPFGPNGLPLYEGCAAIWASDDLEYEGGGATHASAYNYYHNKMAARLAKLLGYDATPYQREADLIWQGMHRELWLADRGWFAEWKDYLGLQSVHPNAALWTFYHTVDSEAATAMEAWQMTRFIDTQIAHLPLRGAGVPEGYYTLPTTSWMPYTWSLNNVVMAESQHTALGFWQAGRADEAFRLCKGSILDSMFLGLCPGNVGMCTWFDASRRESQRDFADGIGMTSRALVEGLFGVTPDALAGELRIRPGFPADWDHAALRHPDFSFDFQREGMTETFTIEPAFPKPMALRLQVAALRDDVTSVTVNGAECAWHPLQESVGWPRIEIESPAVPRYQVVIVWKGAPPASVKIPAVVAQGETIHLQFEAPLTCHGMKNPQGAMTNPELLDGGELNAVVVGTPGDRTFFAEVRQGKLAWSMPISIEVRPPYEIVPAQEQPPAGLKFRLRNNTSQAIDVEAAIYAGGHAITNRVRAAAVGESDEIELTADGLWPGSNPIRMDLGGGRTVAGGVVNWQLASHPPKARWEMVDLTPLFNDRVTQIFRNEYRSPRSPFCSLAIPKQGIGSWCTVAANFEVDDRGLRAASAQAGGHLETPFGVPLQTPGPGDGKNIIFTSRWDNYPSEVSVPLQGHAARACLLLAGSSNPMQSQFDNGEVVVTYADGSTNRLALRNPTTWWPIDQDYFTDDFAFRRTEPIPPRVDLRTGRVRVVDSASFKGRGGKVPGGAATILDLPLNQEKELKSLTVRTLANEVVIGLMAVTLETH